MAPNERLTRREVIRLGGAGAAIALGVPGCGAEQTRQGRGVQPAFPLVADARPAPVVEASASGLGGGPGRRLPWILDMVLDNPGQAPTQSILQSSRKLASWGYDGQVIADWRPPTTAITYDALDGDIFPPGSDARAWVQANAAAIDARTSEIHAAGLKALYHTDMIVLPTALVERYGEQLGDDLGPISLGRPMTRTVLQIAVAEVFTRFPYLDGLVIRTGEIYLQDLPYHTGADPITRGPASHLELLDILREEVCAKRGKLIFYRTWAFDGFTTSAAYYRAVTDHIAPHPLLTFAIKHTDGDFWRTVAFNPTLGVGRHQQVVEVECQREYEGKGAHPNYIANGVIDGFEEFRSPAAAGGAGAAAAASAAAPIGLAGLAGNDTFAGVLTWGRGGGWNGPYITDELWCDLNAYVVSHWAQNAGPSEEAVFERYAADVGVAAPRRANLRRLALLSATGVLHGHYSTVLRLSNLAWTRDEYLGGSDQDLAVDFETIIGRGLGDRMLVEKTYAAAIWRQIVGLADAIAFADPATTAYARVSSRYGSLLYSLIEHGWGVMLLGAEGARGGTYDRDAMRLHLQAYDAAWGALHRLRAANPSCATSYVPYSFGAAANSRTDPTADLQHGMGPSIDRYRPLVARG